MAGGMEYGIECCRWQQFCSCPASWPSIDCGDVVEIEDNKGVIRPESECKTTCPGDPRYYCGQGARLTYYTWSLADPLYKWNYPTGSAAGNYRLFCPGVVVPLITTLGVNGKVTFVEKAGTGAKNSTGSFELDPSKADTFSQAWRTMTGLKTDVFCSASLTLPDKGGRQLNIGGWSGTSTVSRCCSMILASNGLKLTCGTIVRYKDVLAWRVSWNSKHEKLARGCGKCQATDRSLVSQCCPDVQRIYPRHGRRAMF